MQVDGRTSAPARSRGGVTAETYEAVNKGTPPVAPGLHCARPTDKKLRCLQILQATVGRLRKGETL